MRPFHYGIHQSFHSVRQVSAKSRLVTVERKVKVQMKQLSYEHAAWVYEQFQVLKFLRESLRISAYDIPNQVLIAFSKERFFIDLTIHQCFQRIYEIQHYTCGKYYFFYGHSHFTASLMAVAVYCFCRRTVYVCPSVCLSVMFIYSVETSKHIFKIFHHRVATPFYFFHQSINRSINQSINGICKAPLTKLDSGAGQK